MLPIIASQILFVLSLAGLAALVVSKFGHLKSLNLEGPEHETFRKFMLRHKNDVQREARVLGHEVKRGYLKLLTKTLHQVKITSMKIDAETTKMLRQMKTKTSKPMKDILDAEEERGGERVAAPASMTTEDARPAVEPENHKNGSKFFETLKEDPDHHKFNGKNKDVKKLSNR